MTDDRTFERAARSWLEAGPTQAPDRAVESALARIETTRQERDLRIPWRLPDMFTNRVAIAALALVLIVAGGGFALSRLTGVENFGPGAIPTPTASASPSMSSLAPSLAPSPTTATIGASDVGKSLISGTYRVAEFAAPFGITLPAGWTANEITTSSVSIARSTDASVNVYLAVVNKTYVDPCHPERGVQDSGSSVEELVAALSAMPGSRVADEKDATVGGAPGKTFSFTTALGNGCSKDPAPFVTHDVGGENVDIAIFRGEIDQFWVVNAFGTRVLVAITNNRVPTVQSILDSINFIDGSSN